MFTVFHKQKNAFIGEMRTFARPLRKNTSPTNSTIGLLMKASAFSMTTKPNKKTPKASWWIRSRRKIFVKEVLEILQPCNIEAVWVHSHFIKGETKRPRQATFYISFETSQHEELFRIEAEMDKHFKRKKVNLIDIASLQPSIKEFVFKDLERVL